MPSLSLSRAPGRGHARLSLDRLEEREVPTGIVTASLVNGVLTLTGDDAANVFTLQVTGGGAVLTPDSTTTIDDLAVAGPGTPNTPVPITGTVKTLKVALKGGNDELTADATTALALTGGAVVDLGDGDNDLDLTTTAKIDLASLSVKGGDGDDTVTVKGGAGLGSRVTGTATFALGFGDGDTTLGDMTFGGPAGVTVSGTGGTGTVDGTNVIVSKTFTGNFGDSVGKVTFDTSTLGGLKETGYSSTATLNTVTVNGNVALVGTLTASLTGNPATVSGTVDVGVSTVAGSATATWKGASSVGSIKVHGGSSTLTVGNATTDTFPVAGKVTVAGVRQSVLTESKGTMTAAGVTVSATEGNATFSANGTSVQINGPLAVTGRLVTQLKVGAGSVLTAATATVTAAQRAATLTAAGASATFGTDVTITGLTGATLDHTAGAFAARNVKLTSPAFTTLGATGSAMTVNGNLQVTSKLSTDVDFATSALSEVKGTVAVTGGPDDDSFVASSRFKAHQTVTLKLGNGDNTVTLGDTAGALAILGNLSILTGVGVDAVTLRAIAQTGTMSLILAAGADTLAIDDAAVFSAKVTVDMGGGDDTVNIAQDKNQAGPVLFNGLTSILGGAGNDTLQLGRTAAAGGDTNSAAQFVAGSVLDGGLGLDVFDPDAQFTGATVKWD